MIQATYYRGANRLTVTGHAGAAAPGHDLVCACASMLVYTLAANVAGMAEAGQVRQPVIRTDPGDAELSCCPGGSLRSSVTLVFDSICAGFELLAHDYPEYVKYERRQ